MTSTEELAVAPAVSRETAPTLDERSFRLAGPPFATAIADDDGDTPRTWSVGRYLAVAAIPLLAYQIWTLMAWLLDGPSELTEYRDTDTTSWYVAKITEVTLVIVAVGIVVHLGRRWRRAGELTFDALLLIGLLSTVFWDTVVNFVEPIWLYSSNWTNVNAWWGNAPFILNPAAGTVPEPIVMQALAYPILGYVLAILVNRAMLRMEMRWPSLSRGQVLGLATIAIGVGLMVVVTLELPAELATLPGQPSSLAPRYTLFGVRVQFTFAECCYALTWILSFVVIRYFRDADGVPFPLRGLKSLPRRRRTTMSVLAMIAYCNLAVIVLSAPVAFLGLYADRDYLPYPPHLVNGVCDAPGWSGTHYGPCPGSPNFEMPLRSAQGH